MPLEIERKFLLKNDNWRRYADKGSAIKQGYLNSHIERTVRIRIINKGGIITIKGKTTGVTRKEFEYKIPLADALELIKLCEKPIIEKTRYKIETETGLIWEIDEFSGQNTGLIIAEVELEQEHQSVIIPQWIGKEVSDDPRYYNANLIQNPFENWGNPSKVGQ